MNNNTKYGIYIAITLIAYFLLLDLLGLADQVYLIFFNAILTAGGLFLAVRDVYKEHTEDFEYMLGFKSALVAGFIGTLIYTIFMAVYLFEINTDLATKLEEQVTLAGEGIEVAVLLFIFLSGIATSIVAALVILPIYKKSWNTKQVRRDQNPMNHKS